MRCNWCEKEVDKLNVYQDYFSEYEICDNCLKQIEKGVCRTCGELLDGVIAYKGECYQCQQISASKKQKHKIDVLNGIFEDPKELELMSGSEFTEEDYVDWMTFGSKRLSPEEIRRNRLIWVKIRLKRFGWTDELIDNNINDFYNLLDRHGASLVRNTLTVVLNDGTRPINGVIVDRSGSLYLVQKAGTEYGR